VLELSLGSTRPTRARMTVLTYTKNTSSLLLVITTTSIRLNWKQELVRYLSIKTLLESTSLIITISTLYLIEVRPRELVSDYMILKTLLNKIRTTHTHYLLMFKLAAKDILISVQPNKESFSKLHMKRLKLFLFFIEIILTLLVWDQELISLPLRL